MRDVGCHFSGWVLATHENPSDNHSTVLVNEDSSNESESNNNKHDDDDNNPDPSNNNNNNSLAPPDRPIPSSVSVTVGLPTRFGNPASSDEDAGASPSPEYAIDNTNFREQILRNVTVNDESALRAAIDNLGEGSKDLKAVLDYVHHFQRDPDAESVDPDAFTRGLEHFCLLYEKENSVANPRAPDAGVETHATDVNTLNQHTLHPPNVDPYAMSMNLYMESMSGYYHHPNFCYPYPPFAAYAPFNMGVPPMYMPMMGVPYFTPPAHEYVPMTTADVVNRASRKSRIARRRVLGRDPGHHPRSVAKPAAHGGGGVGGGVQTQNANVAVASAGQGLNTNDLMFLLAKQLSPSGVSSLGRIVLPKKEAEAHLPHLVASEGVLLTMADFDTRQSWTFRYRFWSNNKSRMYLLENTRDFVKAHNLQERDMLVLYRDAGGSYVVRGEKNGANNQMRDGGVAAVEDALTEDEVSRKKQKV